MMKKTLVAVAAIAATASYAQTTVTLSGRGQMEYSTFAATGSVTSSNDYNSRSRLADNGSRITFAVSEDLGGGLKAGVYCETGINMDNAAANGQSDVNNSSASEWCSRESRLTIGNDTAELRLGRQNVWWGQGELNDTGSNKVGIDVSSNMFLNHGAGGGVTRVSNVIKVVLGKSVGAFNGTEIYTAVDAKNESAGSGVEPNTRGKNPVGFTLKYALSDALVSQIDYYSQSSTPTATSVNSFDRTMTRWGLGYKYAPGSIVSAQYYTNERTDLGNPNAGTAATPNVIRLLGDTSATSANVSGNVKNSGYILNLNHDLGNGFTAVAQYSRAGNITTGTSSTELGDSGAVGYTLGGLYRLSKRTHVYGAMNSLQNGINSNANLSGGGQAAGTVSFGSTVNVTAFGLQHNF
jgi:predicted porin